MPAGAFLHHGLNMPGLDQAAVDVGDCAGFGLDGRDLMDHGNGLSDKT